MGDNTGGGSVGRGEDPELVGMKSIGAVENNRRIGVCIWVGRNTAEC
jgi:hypothetical protein